MTVNVPVPVRTPHPLTLPEPVTVPEDTKEITSMNPAGQTVPDPISVAEPVPSPHAVIVTGGPVAVNVPLVASIRPQPTTVGAHPETVPEEVTAGNPSGAR